jgi:GTPase SAR1 family protein
MFALLFITDGVGKTSLIQSLRSDSFKRETKLLGSKSGRNQRKGICIEDNTTTAAAKQADFSPLLDSLTDSSIQLQFWEFSGTRSRSPLSLVVLRSFCPHLFSLSL